MTMTAVAERLSGHASGLIFHGKNDAGASSRAPAVTKVGPHGYIHGWIKVGDEARDAVPKTYTSNAEQRQIPVKDVTDKRSAAAYYTSDGYKLVNDRLRRYKGDVSQIKNGSNKAKDPDHLKIPNPALGNAIDHLDSALNESRTTHPIMVYRGVKGSKALFGRPPSESLVGAKWTDHGYASTATDEKSAKPWASGSFLMRLHVSPGTPAINVPSRAGENEVLLGRGLQYTVTGDDQATSGVRTLDVEVSDPGSVAKIAGTWPQNGGVLNKVGPKGWVHGWHYVGGPGLPSVVELRKHGDSTEKYAGEHDGYTAGRRDLHSKIVEESLAGHSQKKAPVAIFMGGGAGAGKSTMKSQMRGAIIDADHYKEQLPEYQALKEAGEKDAASYTYREGGRMAQDAVTEATNRGLDFTLDGAGAGGYDSMKERTDNARRGGHHIHAIYVTTDTNEAVRRANARGKVTGRYVPEPIMRAAHASVSQTFRDAVQKGGLFDSAELWDNNGEAPSLVGEMKPGQPFQVHDQAAWERFLAKADEA